MKKIFFLCSVFCVFAGIQLKAQSPIGAQTTQTIPLMGNGQMNGNLTLNGKLLVNDKIVTNRITYTDSALHIGDSSLLIENFLISNGAPYNYDRISSDVGGLAVGAGCVSTTSFATSMGHSSTASASNATAIGSFVTASGTQAVALGSGTGTNHVAAGPSSITMGVNVQTGSSASNATAIGRNITNSTANSLMIGYSPTIGSTVPSIFVGPAASSSVGGKIGLGTSSPSTALHVIGETTVSSLAGTGTRSVLVDNTGKLIGGGINWALGGNSVTVPTNSSTEYLGTSSNSDLYINTNATTKMLIKTSGWVGIGTTTPTNTFSSMFEVKATGGNTLSITGDAAGDVVSSGSLRPHFANTTDFSVYEGYPGTGTSTLRMILKNGNMGVGVPVPTSTLHVGGDATINSLAGTGTRALLVDNNGKLVAGTSSTTSTVNWALGGNDFYNSGTLTSNVAGGLGTMSNDHLNLMTNNTLRLQISNDGNFTFGYNPGFVPTGTRFNFADNGVPVRVGIYNYNSNPVVSQKASMLLSNNGGWLEISEDESGYGSFVHRGAIAMNIMQEAVLVGTRDSYWSGTNIDSKLTINTSTTNQPNAITRAVKIINPSVSSGNSNHTVFEVLSNGTTHIGTYQAIGNHNDALLSVYGKVLFKSAYVNVSTAVWSDYVFDESYRLQPLNEVEAYYKKYKHLPGVPSATEMEINGDNLVETDALLLKKIEELTIHIVELEKELKELKKSSNK